ncbi:MULTISPECIES: hypothetical protein [unclassified Microcystis]|uniref:hypothetical protein n=1 Tax=unclassified Microcystis TaxID=2643300 RepID=UPI00258B8EC2|nr:hypothetical protein [Microcystis sp. LE19-195.1E]
MSGDRRQEIGDSETGDYFYLFSPFPPATRTKWSPHTLHPTPYTPHPTPHTLHPTPYTHLPTSHSHNPTP